MTTYRHVLVPRHRSQRVAERGLRATIEWLNYSSYASSEAVETEDGWTTYTLRPGPYAHNLFVEGAAPSDDAAFETLVVAAGDSATSLSLGEEQAQVCFYVRFDGCRFAALLDEFEERLHQVMVVKTETFSLADAH